MTYRDDAPSLRAECERLRAEVARLRAKPARVPMRWRVVSDPRWPDDWSAAASLLWTYTLVAAAVWAIGFIASGWCGWTQRYAAALAAGVALWTLAFVRRVPAEGSAR